MSGKLALLFFGSVPLPRREKNILRVLHQCIDITKDIAMHHPLPTSTRSSVVLFCSRNTNTITIITKAVMQAHKQAKKKNIQTPQMVGNLLTV